MGLCPADNTRILQKKLQARAKLFEITASPGMGQQGCKKRLLSTKVSNLS